MWPHRRQPTRLPRPWDSPGKNTGVGCHFLLQCVKMKSEREVAQWCPTLGDPTDFIQPTSLLCPWDFPGKSTGVGCHCLLWLRNLPESANFQAPAHIHWIRNCRCSPVYLCLSNPLMHALVSTAGLTPGTLFIRFFRSGKMHRRKVTPKKQIPGWA